MAEKETWPEYLLGNEEIKYWEIIDPKAKDLDNTRVIRDQITDLVKKLIKEIPEVIDNMVESVEIYSCKSEIIEKETICEKDTEGNLVDPSTCEVVTKEPTYGEKKV